MSSNPVPDHRDDPVVRADVEIAAPPDRVFEALTDPGELAAWWGDVPGGPGREAIGEYLVVDPPRTLVHTWEPGGDEPPSVVRYDLAPARVGGGPGTRLTVTHTIPAHVQQTLALAA